MKQLIGFDQGTYTFDASARTLTIVGVTFSPEQVLIATNVTDGVMVYCFADPTLGGTWAGQTVTLNYDTSSMSDTDDIQIYADLPLEPGDQQPVAVSPALPGRQPAASALPVTLTNEQVTDLQGPIISLVGPTVGAVLSIQDCLQYRSAAIQILTGAGVAAGVIQIQGSNGLDAASGWTALEFLNTNSNLWATSQTLAASTSYLFAVPIYFRFLRTVVTTLVTAGTTVTCNPVYRIYPLPVGGVTSNVQQVAGSTVSTATTGVQAVGVSYIGSTALVTGGVAGMPAVGGNLAPGAAVTSNPVPMGAVDYSSLTRRIITDNQGHQVVVGPDATRVAQTRPVMVAGADEMAGRQNPVELLERILAQLKLMSFYLGELPVMLNLPNAVFQPGLLTDFVALAAGSGDRSGINSSDNE